MELTFTADSVLKAAPIQSMDLEDGQKVDVKKGETFELIDTPYLIEGLPGEGDDHFLVRLKKIPQLLETRWVVYCPDVELLGNAEDNNPREEPPPPIKTTQLEKTLKQIPVIKELPAVKWGKEIPHDIPGLNTRVRLKQPVHAKWAPNFTWGEATRGGTRIPHEEIVTKNIIKVGKTMQVVRGLLGDRPIRINSWYRDPHTNRRVGGASMSRHLSGDAVDFVVKGLSPAEVYAELNPWWGARGGLASSSVFTHLDCRGYRARWSYGY